MACGSYLRNRAIRSLGQKETVAFFVCTQNFVESSVTNALRTELLIFFSWDGSM